MARSKCSRASSVIPSSARSGFETARCMIRSTTCSPCVVGMIAIRRSSGLPWKRIEMRPSWGARCSAMSRLPMIFRRLITPSCICLGICATGRVTPSLRARTTMSSSSGSKWMSEAPSSIACDRVEQELGRLVVALDALDLRAVELLDRALEVGRLRDGEPHVVAEREAEVVGPADVARVGDGHEQQVLADEPHGYRLVASRELLGQQH